MNKEAVQSLDDLPLAKYHLTPGGHRDSLDDYTELAEQQEVNHE